MFIRKPARSFHFDVPVDDVTCWTGPHPDHNVILFLSSLSEASRGEFIRSIRIYIATRRLQNVSPRAGWQSICRYLASKTQLRHLAIVLVNNCSLAQQDVEDMQELCKIGNPWAKYLAWISGLKSFTLHTARCPCRDFPFEAHDRCPTTLPLTSEVERSFNERHRWTAEDRANGLVIRRKHGAFQKSHDPASGTTTFQPFLWRTSRCLHLSRIQSTTTQGAWHRVLSSCG